MTKIVKSPHIYHEVIQKINHLKCGVILPCDISNAIFDHKQVIKHYFVNITFTSFKVYNSFKNATNSY